MTENQNQAPALTLEPAMTRDKVMMEEAVKQLEAAPAAAAEATAEMDTSMLSARALNAWWLTPSPGRST